MNIVITGSSTGIGKFLADSLVSKGHAVCRIARSPQKDFSIQCDVADWPAVERAAKTVAQKWKTVDALICCAGILDPIGPAMEIDPVAWRDRLGVAPRRRRRFQRGRSAGYSAPEYIDRPNPVLADERNVDCDDAIDHDDLNRVAGLRYAGFERRRLSGNPAPEHNNGRDRLLDP